MFWLACGAWAQIGDLGACGQSELTLPQVPPVLRAAFSQTTVTWCHMGRWAGWSGKHSTSSEAHQWPGRAVVSAWRNLLMPDKATYAAWSCSEPRGWKEVNHLGSPGTQGISYPIASHSVGMGCHGDLFPTSNLFKAISLLLWSLRSQ